MARAPAFPAFYPEPTPEELAASREAAMRAPLVRLGPPPPPRRPRSITAADVERLNPLTFATGKSIEELLAEEREGAS